MPTYISLCREAALALIIIWMFAELFGMRRRIFVVLIASLLTLLLTWRGVIIEFFPLTNKYESFLAFAATLAAVGAWRYQEMALPGRLTVASILAMFVGATLGFDDRISYPPPLMITTWYPLHVPISFFAYATWTVAATDGLDYALAGVRPGQFVRRQENNIRIGLLAFSLSMVFGGIWGVVSWGAYFLWDAKVIWSLAAWLYFATMLHLKYWPVRPGKARVALGLIGLVVVFVTYVGTSFMSGSIHKF